MDFSNAAMIRRDEFTPFALAVGELLGGQMATNSAITVVERTRLQRLLDEQKLTRSGAVDPATAVRVGRLLGAQYMLFGVVVVDPEERVVLDVRAVDVSTSQVVARLTARDRDAGDIMGLVDRLASDLNRSLRLPGNPRAAPASAVVDRAQQRRALVMLGRAMVLEDSPQGVDSARALYRAVLTADQRITAARAALQRLGGVQ